MSCVLVLQDNVEFINLETDNFKTNDIYSLFSVFMDDRGEIYRLDLEEFMDIMETDIKIRRVTRLSSNLDCLKQHDTDEIELPQIEYLIRVIKETLGAQIGKIDELNHEDVTQASRKQLMDMLFRLNDDLYGNFKSLEEETSRVMYTLHEYENRVELLNNNIEDLEYNIREVKRKAYEKEVKFDEVVKEYA